MLWSLILYGLMTGDVPEIEGPELPHLDKILHFGVFFILSFLWYLPLTAHNINQAAILAIILSIAYGLWAEWLQSHLPNRSADPLDIVANTLGSLALLLVITRMKKRTTTGRRGGPKNRSQ